jgi:3-isopropylmalate dehydrogenase
MQGDGIGPEITAATLKVLRAAGARWQIEFAFEEVEVGLAPLKTEGTTFPERAFAAAQAADGVILGPVSHNDYPPADKGGINPSGALRKRLDLFANIRPAKTRAQFPRAAASRSIS